MCIRDSYLRPVPAMTVIAYEPKTDQLKVPVQVCRNELIRSRSEKSSLTAQTVSYTHLYIQE